MEVLSRLFKIWVINWSFIQREIEAHEQMAREEERPKVFQAAQKDILETMADDLEKRANEIADKKLEGILSVVDYSQIVGQRGKQIYVGGELVDDAQLANLKADAAFLAKSDIWKLLKETPKELAQRALFKDDGKSEVLHAKGRSMLYLLDTQQKIVDILNSL